MGRYRTAARNARNLTNKQLGTELALLAPLSRAELNRLLPRKTDKQAFLALMSQVEAGTAMDTKLAFLRDNLQTAGKVVFKVLKAFV